MRNTKFAVALALAILMASFASAGLQNYYRFDSTGMSTLDYSQNGQDNMLKGGSFRMDGRDDYISVNHSGRLNLSIDNGYAVSTWFKVRNFSDTRFRLGSMGHNDYGRAGNFSPAYDSFMNINGNQICDNCARGFTIAKMNSSWGLNETKEIDTHGGDGYGGDACNAAGNMSQYLQSQPEGTKMIMITDDQPHPAGNCDDAAVLEEWEETLKDYGANGEDVTNKSEFVRANHYRASYMLIGSKGAGNKNAYYWNFRPRYSTALYMKSGQIVRIGRQAGLRTYDGKLQGFTDGVESEASLSTGWHHAVIQFTSDNRSELWLDGEKVGDKSVNPSDNLIYGADNEMIIGGPLFHGSVDQVTVYDQDLTATDIQKLSEQDYIGKNYLERWKMNGTTQEVVSTGPLMGDFHSGGTVAAWRMNDGAGSTTEDQSENNVDATLTNTSWVDGVSGQALNFSGDSYASLGQVDQLADNQEITISTWVYPEKRVDDWQAFFGDDWDKYLFGIPRNGKEFSFDVRNTTNDQINAIDYSFPEWQRWYHVVAVADANRGFLKIYVNGTLETSTQKDFTMKNTTGPAFIGSLSDSGNTDRFYGKIDEMTISTTAWGQDEVEKAFETQKARAVERYNFTSGKSTGSEGLFYTNAYSFDGSDDYIQIDHKLPDNQTVSAWIKTTDGAGTNHWQTKAIAHQENSGPANDWGFGIDSEGKLVYGNGNGSSDRYVNSDRKVADGRWHHVAFTREKSSGLVKLFIDGSLDGSAYLSTTSLTDADRSGGGIQIGRAGDNSPAKFTNMEIDEFRIYDEKLADQEIARLAFK
ncbi:LamG-like jellyroll fold domain-containing protein [Candidatus Nanohalovita haloferacivicina]|uniref:LamG-like jellyroll fold domain-containing protein n=1 Tax=Candidatus Nanohalovita haloferacivicina TaxID=2978046 RepID=UPI00325FCEEE